MCWADSSLCLFPAGWDLTPGTCCCLGLGGPELNVWWVGMAQMFSFPASEGWIPCPGTGNNHSLLTAGPWGCDKECCHHGGDRPALAWSPSLLWGAGGICKPGGLAASKGRNQDSSHSLCLKEQEHHSILRSREGSNSFHAWLNGFGYCHSSNFHWQGFRSDGHPLEKKTYPHSNCTGGIWTEFKFLAVLFFLLLPTKQTISSVNVTAERCHEGAGNSGKARHSRKKKKYIYLAALIVLGF